LAAVRCVTLDLDDTLFLERDYVASGFRAVGEWVSAHLGLNGFSDAAWSLFEHGRRGTIFDEALRQRGVPADPETVRQMLAVYRSHSPEISLLDDARGCLDALLTRVRMAVVSDGPLESQAAKARSLGIERWTDVVVFTAAFGPGYSKPHPRGFLTIAERTGASGHDCAYVGDNPSKDFTAPASLGWRTIRVRRPGSLHEGVLSGPDVEFEVADLQPLASLLELT
jgi:putative hydrolase of the HAD superfamily